MPPAGNNKFNSVVGVPDCCWESVVFTRKAFLVTGPPTASEIYLGSGSLAAVAQEKQQQTVTTFCRVSLVQVRHSLGSQQKKGIFESEGCLICVSSSFQASWHLVGH